LRIPITSRKGQDLLVPGDERRAVEVLLVLPPVRNRAHQGFLLFIRNCKDAVRGIGIKLVDGGFQKRNGREEGVEHERLVAEPEFGGDLPRPVLQLDRVPEPAEDSGGLDIPDTEAVPVPDDHLVTGRLKGDLVHRVLHYSFLEVKKVTWM
jgi:hypothetical protein